MARTTKRGTCDLCGANSNVGTNHGSKVCTNCTHIQSALSKRPQSVANAIRAMGKTEDILGHLIPAGGLAVKVTADLLQEISGIVEYKGEDPAELVAAVRKRVLTCASCDAEDVLHEIREIVGYTPEQEDRGLADAVRWLQSKASSAMDCTALCSDLLSACGLEMDDTEDGEGWDVAVAAAIKTIAELLNRQYEMSAIILRDHEAISNLSNEITRLNGKTHSESAEMTELRADLNGSEREIASIRSQLTLAQQSRDEWEQRAVYAEMNVETLEAEVKEADTRNAKLQYQLAGYAPEPCPSTTYLLDIALRALRGEGPDADQLATLLEAARRAA